ncbi:hypothetical protein [Colwellia sp. MEBiC06753]
MNLKIWVLGLAIILTSLKASAVLITVDDVDYNVDWKVGFFVDIDAEVGLQNQLWWGNASLAEEFAVALGFVDDGDFLAQFGPMFAYDLYNDNGGSYTVEIQYTSPYYALRQEEYQFAFAFIQENVPSVPAPAPAILILLGLATLIVSRIKSK